MTGKTLAILAAAILTPMSALAQVSSPPNGNVVVQVDPPAAVAVGAQMGAAAGYVMTPAAPTAPTTQPSIDYFSPPPVVNNYNYYYGNGSSDSYAPAYTPNYAPAYGPYAYPDTDYYDYGAGPYYSGGYIAPYYWGPNVYFGGGWSRGDFHHYGGFHGGFYGGYHGVGRIGGYRGGFSGGFRGGSGGGFRGGFSGGFHGGGGHGR